MTPVEQKKYDTGAVRSGDCESTRYDLISPIGLEALARTYAEGAEKFGAFNWENGMPAGDLLNHALAHVYKFLRGDRSEDHLSHAAWNLLGAIHSLEQWPHLNAAHLRGPNCECPAAAMKQGTAPAAANPPVDEIAIPDVSFAEIAPQTFAVSLGGGVAESTTTTAGIEAELESLKAAIFSAENPKK